VPANFGHPEVIGIRMFVAADDHRRMQLCDEIHGIGPPRPLSSSAQAQHRVQLVANGITGYDNIAIGYVHDTGRRDIRLLDLDDLHRVTVDVKHRHYEFLRRAARIQQRIAKKSFPLRHPLFERGLAILHPARNCNAACVGKVLDQLPNTKPLVGMAMREKDRGESLACVGNEMAKRLNVRVNKLGVKENRFRSVPSKVLT
jgi:hypothetical protein